VAPQRAAEIIRALPPFITAVGLFVNPEERDVERVLARVPLATGLLTGKLTPDSQFAEGDHRHFNRHGESFDVGETFSGVDFETGLRAVEDLRPLVPAGASMAQLALRWILMFPEVTAAIPGARTAEQAEGNARAADLAPLPLATMEQVRAVYDRYIRGAIHDRW